MYLPYSELKKIGFDVDEHGKSHLLIKARSNDRYWLISNKSGYGEFKNEMSFFSTTFFMATLFKKIVLICKFLGIEKKIFKHVGVAFNEKFKQYPEVQLNSAVSIYSGTESSDRKVTVKITSIDNLTFYLKIAKSSRVNNLFINEKEALLIKSEDLDKCFIAPRFLGIGNTSFYWLLQSGTDWSSKGFDHTTREVMRYILEKEASSQITTVEKYIDSQDFTSIKNIEINRVVKKIVEYMGNEVIKTNHMHGDFTYWNVGFVNDDLYVFDWEYAGFFPVQLDYIHYKFSLIKRNNIDVKSCMDIIKSMREELNQEDPEVYMALYALIMSVRYQGRDNVKSGWVDHDLHNMIFNEFIKREN